MLHTYPTCVRHGAYGASTRSLVYALTSQPVRYRTSATRNKAPLSVSAFRRSPEPVVTLPLDYYNLLDVNKACSAEAVRVAYERQLQDPPEVGYTQDTLYSRAVLLRNAADCLQDYQRRREYEVVAQSRGYAVDVSPDNLPAALVLLQESGQSKIVIELGTQWLQRNSHYPLACDVAAAVALAHCDEAADALHEDSSVVLTACQNLELSLQLMRQYRMAPQLQQQIMQTLEDYSPRYCLELLALPMDEGLEQQRQRGITLLRKLVFELPRDLSPIEDIDSFLSDARTHMTPQELLSLYSALPRGSHIGPQQKLDMALATVAVGVLHRQPHLVQHAAAALKQLQLQAAKDGQELDLSVDCAACALMLGNMQQAQQLLGLTLDDSSSPMAHVDGSIAAFVLEHSPDGADLLPGVYVLSERWLQEAVLGSFRQDNLQVPVEAASLGTWFDSKTIQAYIQAHALLRRISIFRTLQIISNAAAAAFSWFVTGLQNLFALQGQPGQVSAGSTGQLQLKQQQAARQHVQQPTPLPLASRTPVPAQHIDADDDLAEQELNVSQLRQQWHRQTEEHHRQAVIDPGVGVPIEEHMQLLKLEAAMWDSTRVAQGSFLAWWRRLIAMLLVAGAAGAVWAFRPKASATPMTEVWALATGH